ncbi:putative glycosyl transferase [Lasiosphaeria ovina]|uniref:Glycosyl transferase n=1 Tax=Lasiosphaeria ovina TaxID=92902 RepID=A0AAE0KH60_9PEZI|nr:putative glycosyl transferase [Lasiosphaeria ovina]
MSPRLIPIAAVLVFISLGLVAHQTFSDTGILNFRHPGADRACLSQPSAAPSSPAKDGDKAGHGAGGDDVVPPGPVHIPNTVHFVYIFKEGVSEFNFEFKHFLSVYSAWYYWRPEIVYMHTNAGAPAVEAAREGKGKGGRPNQWNQLIFNAIPNLRINSVDEPKVAGNGREINVIEHKSDFVRTQVVREMGGVYLDLDAHALRDVRALRECGFATVFGRQKHGQVNNGIFFGRKDALLLNRWWEEMNAVYDGGWTTHGNGVLTWLGPRLAREPGEVLILEQDALQPGSWEVEDNKLLFGIHNETASNLPAGFHDGDPLPEHAEAMEDRWNKRKDPAVFPDWQRDYSSTWVLHAFDPGRNNNPVPGFSHISPRYVLERQSNFARAVYPVVRHMYDEGLIKVDDSYKGAD